MLEPQVLDLKVSLRVKEMLELRGAASGLTDPLPAIIWGKWNDETDEDYSIGFYERERLPADDPIRIVTADGVDFLILQEWICDELKGKVLDMIDGRLAVREPS
jgi:hypothetical protein